MRPMTSGAVDWALAYARRGWPVFPVRSNRDPLARKYPLTEHGKNDASSDEQVIVGWWRRWPNAVPSIVTGAPSGIVALDIDIRPDGCGFDSLDELGVTSHPDTPTAHTPRGGCAVLFRWPGQFVKTCAGELAPHLDIRGDRGSVMLPPGPGRFWDPTLGPDTAIAPMPAWMATANAEMATFSVVRHPISSRRLSRYAEAALDGAVKSIIDAPAGQQRDTLNREIYSIARLVGGGTMPAGLAIEALQWAALRLRSFDPRRPWRPGELDKLVRAAFTDGLAQPRHPDRVA
jgi:Bifunctional DNA primase/polymerase, N-terminal